MSFTTISRLFLISLSAVSHWTIARRPFRALPAVLQRVFVRITDGGAHGVLQELYATC